MQCDNCGYIFFQPAKKCACCSAPYVPAMSSFDVGQENLFTIFEMAPGEGGIPGGMGMTGAGAGVEDYNFTDDFDTGATEYGVDENVLDLSDAEAEGYGPSDTTGSISVGDFEFDTSGMDDVPTGDPRLDIMENAGPDDFELNLSDDLDEDEAVSTETVEPKARSGDDINVDFDGGFDEVEGLGFGFDETPAEETPDTEEISTDTASEPEISLEPDMEPPEEEPSVVLSEDLDLDMGDEQPSLELSEDPSLELPEDPTLDMGEMDAVEEEPSLELPDDLDLPEEPELMDAMEDDGGIDFDLDSVDLDEPEDVAYEVPDTETGDPATPMDFEGLELEMETPEEPEDEDLKP